jgi:hypothetical protein
MRVPLLVAIGARAVADDFDGFVFLGFFHEAHQAEGVEELGGDVGEGASTLGGDAIANQEKQEFGEELVDFIGSMEVRDLVEKFGGKVVRVLFGCAETGVAEAEAGTGVQDGELTWAARAGAMTAKRQVLRRDGDRCCLQHDRPRKKDGGGYPPSL